MDKVAVATRSTVCSLREKQKARRFYGVLEKQFERYYEEAARRQGVTGENLLQTSGEPSWTMWCIDSALAASRKEARQLVRHGHFNVNGRRVDIPSYLTKVGDVIAVREKSQSGWPYEGTARTAAESRRFQPWLELDLRIFSGKVVRIPARDEIDTPVAEQMIVEHYSR